MTAARPTNVVVVSGTATDVGKTWVASALLDGLRAAGRTVSARKPGQSFAPTDASTDRDVLAAATGEAATDVCPDRWCYPVPLAPPMAADVLGSERPDAHSIRRWLVDSWPAQRRDVGVVETAGSVGSPIAAGLDSVGVVDAVDADVVVLVADAELGTIGSCRANLALLEHSGATPRVVVHLNRFDDANDVHRANKDWLATEFGADRADRIAAHPIALTTGIGELVSAVTGLAAVFDPFTGRRGLRTEPPPELEPERYCGVCGRRLKVTVVPTGYTSRCSVHGELERSGSPG